MLKKTASHYRNKSNRALRRGLRALFVCSIGLFLVGASACGGEDPFALNATPHIEVNPDELRFVVGNVLAGETQIKTIEVINTGTDTLIIDSVDLLYQASSADEAPGNMSLELVGSTTFPLAIPVIGQGTPSQPDKVKIEVLYRRLDDAPRTAELQFRTNDPDAQIMNVDVIVDQGEALMVVTPDQVVFKNVKSGESPTASVRILNTGNADLIVDRMMLLGDTFFSVIVEETIFEVNDEIMFDPPLVITPSNSYEFEVRFSPDQEQPAQAQLVIYANSANALEGFSVPVLGNDAGPCIDVTPSQVNFGAKLKGGSLSEIDVIINSCGKEDLQVREIRMSTSEDEANPALSDLGVSSSSSQFALGFENSSGSGLPPNESVPWAIPVNQNNTFAIRYTTPDAESPKDETGAPIPDRGHIVIKTNAFQEYVAVEVTGYSVPVLCPTAVIEVAEGTNVIPQTILHLDGTKSVPTSGASVTNYEWDEVQPTGSVSQFVPGKTFATPVFEVNVAGEYVFQLTVWDSTGQESCEPATTVVTVTPDEAIHVELLWHTPGDPNEFDEGPKVGTDLDLHFVHPYAGGQDLDGDSLPDGYFDDIFDCAWFNNAPPWGTVDPNVDDNPGLDRDDTDGAGPENMNLNVPEDACAVDANGNGFCSYKVGVHYWEDPKSSQYPNGFGPSNASVFIYIFGQEVWKKENVPLNEKDMWEVCEISWPDQAIKPIFGNGPGGLKIIPNYVNPFFQ